MPVSPGLTVPNKCHPALLYLMTVSSCLTVPNDSVTLPFPHYCHCHLSLLPVTNATITGVTVILAGHKNGARAHTHTKERKKRTERTTASENELDFFASAPDPHSK